jgi:hypothetical protein
MNEALYVGEEVGDKTPIPQTTPFEFLTQPKEQPKESLILQIRNLLIHLKGEDPPQCHLLL